MNKQKQEIKNFPISNKFEKSKIFEVEKTSFFNKKRIYQIINDIEAEVHSVIKNRENRNRQFQHLMVTISFEGLTELIDLEL
jgi:hypothetical protein